MPTTRPEPRWPASAALVTCAALYLVLADRLVVGPRWLLPMLIILPLIPLSITKHRHPDEAPWVRCLSISLIALVTLANMISVSLLVRHLLVTHVSQGRPLIYSAVAVWFTNIISFGLWYWEIDRGGPHLRAGNIGGPPDIQFPQMENPTLAPPKWRPRFFDYLYTSFANGTSFAPADAMPLSLRVKALFLTESIVSFVTVAVVAGRAVNILN